MGPATGHVAVQKGGTRCGPRGSCIVRFPFHHTTSRRNASANSVRVAIVAEQSIRLLRPEDFLTVGQSDPHPPGDRIQVFPGEREDVGQEGFDALVQRFGKPCAGHGRQGTQPRARDERQARPDGAQKVRQPLKPSVRRRGPLGSSACRVAKYPARCRITLWGWQGARQGRDLVLVRMIGERRGMLASTALRAS